MPILKTCCYSVDLRKGSIIIGALILVFTVPSVIYEVKDIDKGSTEKILRVILGALLCITSALLIFAVVKEKPKLTVPWQIVNAVGLLGVGLWYKEQTLMNFIFIVLTDLVIVVYMGLVVYSYYQSVSSPSPSD